MKTKIFLFAVLTATVLNSLDVQAQVKYGVHGALNLETQAELGQLWNNCELYPGFLIGGFIEYGIGNTLSLQTELNYQKKGNKVISTTEGIESVTKREFNYLSVPLLVKANYHLTGSDDRWDLTFLTGPYLGFLTSASASVKTGDSSVPVDIDDQAETKDWGLIFGGGVVYKLNNGKAIIGELRYEMGLNEVDKQDPDLRNKGIGLTLGYRF